MTQPRRLDIGNRRADQLHLIHGEAVAAHDITVTAGSLDVALNMGQAVVNAVEAAIVCSGSAIDARLLNHFQNFDGSQVTRINALVSLAQKSCTPALGLVPPLHSGGAENALFGRQCAPAFLAAIPALAPLAVAFAAFIRNAKRAARVLQKHFRRCGQFALASIANPHSRSGRYSVIPLHCRNLAVPHI